MKVFSKSGFSLSLNTRENVSRTSIWIRPVDPNWRKWNGQSLEPCFKLSTLSNDRSLLSHQPWKLFSQQFLSWILLFPKIFWKIINQMEKKSSQAKKSGASSCLRLTRKSKKIGKNRLHMLLRSRIVWFANSAGPRKSTLPSWSSVWIQGNPTLGPSRRPDQIWTVLRS